MDKDDEIEHIYLDDEDDAPPTRHEGVAPVELARAVENHEERQKFKRMLIGILIVAALLTVIRGIEAVRFLSDFAAVTLITFAALKFSDIEAFAHAYRGFDILASRIRPWGYVYPFITAFLGFWFLLSDAPPRLSIFTLIITGIAGFGAIRAYRQKSKVQYAYHRKLLRLPIVKVSCIENITLFIAAGLLLVIS